MVAVANTDVKRSDTAFFGHPSGLGWLAFTELWERFSYYGMTALLVLYMTHSLLQPGHIEHIAGFGAFQGLIRLLYGPAVGQALASHIYGFYTAFVYLTPIAGGVLADRVIGRTNAVTAGAILMAMGHFLMAFDATFLLALLCLLLGVGCFKGNISSQVGSLYKDGDPRRADAFQVFLFFVQIAVIASPFVCGRLADSYGWHYGFGAAGIGMLIGLTTYLLGRRTLPPELPKAPPGAFDPARPPFTRNDWIKTVVLVALLPVLAVAIVGNQQIFNAYLVWGEANYQLSILGMHMPITDLLGYGSIISALTIVMSVAFWRWWATRWTEPDELTKIAIGVAISATAPLLLVLASTIISAHGGRVSLWWAVGFEFLNDLGFANVLPVGLALYSRAAPKGTASIFIGVYYLHFFIGNFFVGWVGGLLGTMSATSFWLLHVALILGAAAILIMVRVFVGQVLTPAYAPPPEATA
ncbi:MAG TPA: oligopeptide:H+ symporter [Rhizomicrobium sp.]|jgi:POT family proton-dependent oligopeptide transporter|nr:oligopeptide:H+ symporter [Rhizomicrobium sp.]